MGFEAQISTGVFPHKLVLNLKEAIISVWENWLNTDPKSLLVLNQELLRGYILVHKYGSGPFYNASLHLPNENDCYHDSWYCIIHVCSTNGY